MSDTKARLEQAAKDRKKEIEELTEMLNDHIQAYGILRNACQGIMNSRDLVLRHGSQASMMKVYEMVEIAMSEAEIIIAIGTASDEAATPVPFCSPCNRFLESEELQHGICKECDPQFYA